MLKSKNKWTMLIKRGIDYVIIIGQEELRSNNFKLKDMKSGDESTININNLLSEIENLN